MTKLNIIKQTWDIQKKWENLRTIIKKTAKETIRHEPRRKVNGKCNCKKAIQDRDKAKLEALKSNTEKKIEFYYKKKIKRVIRRGKRTWEELKIRKIEYLNSHNLFGITNELTRKHKPKTMIMKDNNFRIITEEKKIVEKFRNVFMELLGKPMITTEEIWYI